VTAPRADIAVKCRECGQGRAFVRCVADGHKGVHIRAVEKPALADLPKYEGEVPSE
jgi:hypothetical protein